VKRVFSWLIKGILLLAMVLGLGSIYILKAMPKVGPADQNLKIEGSKERIARGEYLAQHVADCMGCHSQRDFSMFGGPIIPGSEFAGGEKVFDRRIGLPGVILPKNITPYNLKGWSDGELVRALRSGVSKDGRPLFPMMPYQHFADMTQEDLYSIIAYLRTLKENKNEVAKTELDFPVNLIVRTIPKEAGPYPADPGKDPAAHGRYLVRMANCVECHSPVDAHHNVVEGMEFAGGQEFPLLNIEGDLSALPDGKARTANLTPDKETGLGSWSKQAFLDRFRSWRGKEGQAKVVKLKNGDFMSPMPWLLFAGMTDQDLGDIYEYLRTVKPVKNAVVKFTPPKG
jgi:mono/diheme cytochrome c family protein